MTITHEQLDMLSRIHNAMYDIRTSGQDTITMADCLRALESVITQISRAPAAAGSEEPRGEE